MENEDRRRALRTIAVATLSTVAMAGCIIRDDDNDNDNNNNRGRNGYWRGRRDQRYQDRRRRWW